MTKKVKKSLFEGYRRSQDFVWGCTFSSKNVDDPFLVVTVSKDSENGLNLLNKPLNLHRPAKKCPKIDSYSASDGCTWCAGIYLRIFPVNYTQNLFHRPAPWGAGAPTAPPGYAYEK